jgi:preprotein translocase subunit SecG
MGVLLSLATGFFIILSALLIVIILLQSDKSAGMGILGGSSQTTFGSSTADVITKITTVMVALFMLFSLGLSILESYSAKSYDPNLEGVKPPANIQMDQTDKTAKPADKPADKPAGKTPENVKK